MDARRRELSPDAPRSGWRYYLQVVAVLSPLWWVPALVVVAIVLIVKSIV